MPACDNQQYNAVTRLAWKATLDTVFGGASALVIAKRAKNLWPEAMDIVYDVYSRSTGDVSRRYGAWECGECGQVYVGEEAAEACCMEVKYG